MFFFIQEELPVIQKTTPPTGKQVHPISQKVQHNDLMICSKNPEEQNDAFMNQIENRAECENEKFTESKPLQSDSELPVIDKDKLSPVRDMDLRKQMRDKVNKPTAFKKLDNNSAQPKIVVEPVVEFAVGSNTFPELKIGKAAVAKLESLPFKKEETNKPQTLSNLIGVEQKLIHSLIIDNSSASAAHSEVSNAGYSAERSAAEAKYDTSPFGISPRYILDRFEKQYRKVLI